MKRFVLFVVVGLSLVVVALPVEAKRRERQIVLRMIKERLGEQ